MVVWRPSVARMVYLHTGTMGVHHACLFSVRRRDVATPEARPRRKAPSLSYAYHRCSRTNWRAPGKVVSEATSPNTCNDPCAVVMNGTSASGPRVGAADAEAGRRRRGGYDGRRGFAEPVP